MALLRMLVTTLQTVSHTFYADGDPVDAGGAVTVAVKRLDGTAVASGTATHASVGTYTWPVTSAVLDTLTVDWTGSVGVSTVTVRDIVEVVGDFFFGLAEVRDELGLPATITDAKLAARRIQVEQECERICRQAFVPRFAREVFSGNDLQRIGLYWPRTRAIRAVSVTGTAWTAPQIAELGFSDAGVLRRPVGATWPAGQRNIVVEYEHGLDLPPQDIHDASMLRLRSLLPRARSGVPDRTTSFTDPGGAVYRLSLPTATATGVPDVDGAYAKWPGPRRIVTA